MTTAKFTQARQLTIAYRTNRLLRPATPALAVARALRTAGAVTVADYLTEARKLTGGVLRSVQGTFGKRVKALAASLGITPLSIPAVVENGGKQREITVAAYAPAVAVRLCTAVWDAHYAN
jgi:hypothetical protein